ncbi:hypothetical protein CDD83_7347 [Cordyceps sp. RAO-2017]|nr:hypothetical protein CDD83_7347 [Cordyceps sp. RAO-2017]
MTAAAAAAAAAARRPGEEDIAIVGSAYRFPGDATSPSRLWALLRAPSVVASRVPALEGYHHADGLYHGHTNVREAYLLAGEAPQRRFDAGFFGVSPAEAAAMDPQLRLLLETVYEAVEAGGLPLDRLRGSDTAVYAGQMLGEYEQLMGRDLDGLSRYHASGTARAMTSNRLSYAFDWRGPSVTIDTACSSSLVALHCAVQQLRAGHSRVAVAAGANLLLDVGTFVAQSKMQMLSPAGRSRMWDAGADGYARGDGVAAVVLKTRRAAEADGDAIEAVIRETAVNQDGRTPGPTSPSASAQAQLIRDCYARAGLDLSDPAHRPQYFEAHGTGTPAGDPVEAEAISSAFFPAGSAPDPPLYVGGIKVILPRPCAAYTAARLTPAHETVIGHSEGAAGLAGIVKASLALQNAAIPPNLLGRLHGRVEPFCRHLRVPVSLTAWPALPGGGPRRASVNSFGFGGTNAHAILESHSPLSRRQQPRAVFIPFVFSAASETSLKAYLAGFCAYLGAEQAVQVDLRDLAYTLDARRTRLPVAAAVAASTAEQLRAKLETKLDEARADPDRRVGFKLVRQPGAERKPRLLGVFTGQGAQWPQMGLDLVTASPAARRVLERLDARLAGLPAAHRPSWSLLEELQKEGSSSRIMEAAVAQPLCTAIQILQVHIVRAAGIDLTAVVGHSSGEIAAAYAAGFVTAEDAVCIAYYRGLFAGLSRGASGREAAMMAVETSAEDARQLLRFPEFEGRACVAAVNSSTSVTLSGDRDAIHELKTVFDDEQKLARLLRVDMAYHSHHMRACSAAYLDALAALGIQLGSGDRTTWFSSVYGSQMDQHQLLKGPYWDANMVSPVLFMQAVDSAAASARRFDMVVELGPHPALRAPTLQTLQDRLRKSVPYTGLFRRGVSASTSVADGLAYAWTHLDKGAVDLQGYDGFVAGESAPRLVKGLPGYAWDHTKEHWHEPRYSRAIRLRPGPVHELLGHLTPNSTEHDMRWRHVLRISELPWLAGHRLQNSVVFPASGYVVGVLEAALSLCSARPATLIELCDVDFRSALVFDHDDSSIETVVALTDISRREPHTIEAGFKYHAASSKDNGALELKACGRVRIQLGQPCDSSLPPRPPRRPNLVPTCERSFYDLISPDFQYSGQFKALERLARKLGAATGFIAKVEPTNLVMHPAVVDAAFHSTFLAYAAPDDGAQIPMHIPRRIRHVTVNPSLCFSDGTSQEALAFDSAVPVDFPHANMVCDIDVYPHNHRHAMMQVEGLECVPLAQQVAKEDKEVFCNVVWGPANPDAQAVIAGDGPATPHQLELARGLEKVASFYLHRLQLQLPSNDPCRAREPCSGLLRLTALQPRWGHETQEELIAACEPFANTVDMRLLLCICQGLLATAEVVDVEPGLVREWYASGLGIATGTRHLARISKQLVHRNPHMHILEVVADIGAATAAIRDEIGRESASYTITGQARAAQDSAPLPSEAGDHVIASDLSKDLRDQGLSEGAYDLVICLPHRHCLGVNF